MTWCRIYSLWASPSHHKRFSRCFANIATTKSRHWTIYWTFRHRSHHFSINPHLAARTNHKTKPHQISKLTMTCTWLSLLLWRLSLCLWTSDRGKRICQWAWRTLETHATSTHSSKPSSSCLTWLRNSSANKSETAEDKRAKTTRTRSSEYSSL